MKNIRIFISSPGDVQLERNIARNVINELSSLYTKHAKFEILMWEDFPLSAHSTFQDGINYFLENKEKPIDIAVFILWSRLGTPLDHKFVKADGTLYQSGTEYEFDLMMHMHRTTNLPSRILTYLKKDDRFPNVLNYEDLSEKLNQKKKLDSFIKEYFHDDATNSNYAYMPFGENNSFEKVFRTHIQNAIKDILGDIDDIKEWEGNPYVGLNSFEYKDSAIFFGRRQLVYETASKLITQDDNNHTKKSLIVLGESGSGKSSFIKAGLLPFFCNKNTSTQYVVVHPSMYGGKMYDGLLDLLNEKIECLKNHPFMEELRKGITNETNFKYLLHALEHHVQKLDLIVYIDQFEELFSDNSITEEERQKVLLLLRGLINMRCITIFMSMRSDFYNRFSLYEEMNQIKQNCEVVDLPVLGPTDITEIVEEPARKACLKWEITDKGLSLNDRIIKEASNIKDLPFIEFALSQLYETRTDDDYLTHAAYEQMGGLNGAIINYADKCYSQLSEDEKKIFNDILGFVITESSSHEGIYVRKTSAREDIEKTAIHKEVIDKMLNARLFVAGKDSHGRPTITITHEILLKSWDVIDSWIKREKEFIASNNHYEQLAQHWIKYGKPNSLLMKDEETLLKAEYFYYHWQNLSSINAKNFLKRSFAYRSMLGVVRWGIYLSFFFIILFFSLEGYDFQEGLVIKDLVALLATTLLAVPMILNLIIHLQRKSYFEIARRVMNIWLSFTFLWIILEGISIRMNPLDYLNNTNYIIDVVLLIAFLGASINAIIKWNIRKNWKKGIFYVPFSTKYLNREKFRIISTIISACSVIIFCCAVLLALLAFDEAEKHEVTQYLYDEQNAFVELIDQEIGFSKEISYAINEKRALYLQYVFPDSIDLASSSNSRRYELARTFFYRGMPDSVITLLKNDMVPENKTLLSYAFLQKGNFREAADCLPENLDTLLSILPTYWMTELDPLDIYIMAGDTASAKKYYSTIIERNPEIIGNPIDSRMKAILNINKHDSLQIYYTSYMTYYKSCINNNEEPILGSIMLSPFVFQDRFYMRKHKKYW